MEASGPESPGFRVEAVGNDDAAVAALVLVVATLAMSLVGLIAASGFVVVAQRRQRQLGMLATLGATPRHLRLVMLSNGAMVGLVSAALGGALGIAGWIVAAPAVEGVAEHRIDRFDLPATLIAACLGLAVLASVAAAWWPARLQARLPVMAALSAARPGPRRSTAPSCSPPRSRSSGWSASACRGRPATSARWRSSPGCWPW